MEVNYLAVILAALAAFFLGYFWYSVIFVKPWQKLIGMKVTKKDELNVPPNLGKLLAGSFILELVMAYSLAVVIGSNSDWQYGLAIGCVVGICFVSFAFGVNYMFEGKSLKLWLINAGYNTVVFALMGLIIGLMG